MNYAAFPVALAAVALMLSPALAHSHGGKHASAHGNHHAHMQMACSADHISKMTAMAGTMPDGSQKWMMNGHLARVNAAMATDGTRGCEMAMMENMHGSGMNMMKGSKMPMMKSGM